MSMTVSRILYTLTRGYLDFKVLDLSLPGMCKSGTTNNNISERLKQYMIRKLYINISYFNYFFKEIFTCFCFYLSFCFVLFYCLYFSCSIYLNVKINNDHKNEPSRLHSPKKQSMPYHVGLVVVLDSYSVLLHSWSGRHNGFLSRSMKLKYINIYYILN